MSDVEPENLRGPDDDPDPENLRGPDDPDPDEE